MPLEKSFPREHHNSALCRLIAQRIAERPQQRITFAEYMDWVLYEPKLGYYAANASQIGVIGDFFTSPHLGPDFGELLAEQFAEMWHVMGCPVPFTLVEMGAGQGLIAADVMRYLRDRQRSVTLPSSHTTPPFDYGKFWAALNYIIVEKAEALIAEQQRLLAPLMQTTPKLKWRSLEELPDDSITGCVFANELVDALPVHRWGVKDGHLQEIYVTNAAPHQSSPFREVLDHPSTPQIAENLAWLGIDWSQPLYPDAYRSELNLAALDWQQTVAQKLHRGYLLNIDYGYTTTQYYHPSRSQGTLQCYYRHAAHNDPYAYVGHQDITAHVNFTTLEQQGEDVGLQTHGFTQQGLFLMALGLGDRLLANNTTSNPEALPDIIRRREALHSLINPLGLGNFGVLVQSKGLTSHERTQTLKGLQLPVP